MFVTFEESGWGDVGCEVSIRLGLNKCRCNRGRLPEVGRTHHLSIGVDQNWIGIRSKECCLKCCSVGVGEPAPRNSKIGSGLIYKC